MAMLDCCSDGTAHIGAVHCQRCDTSKYSTVSSLVICLIFIWTIILDCLLIFLELFPYLLLSLFSARLYSFFRNSSDLSRFCCFLSPLRFLTFLYSFRT